MKSCSVSYELTEQGSGEISAEGIYTAPSKEGVYEIRIYCTDKPLICTYAYAIVKKKLVEEAVLKGTEAAQAESPAQPEEVEEKKTELNLKKGLL